MSQSAERQPDSTGHFGTESTARSHQADHRSGSEHEHDHAREAGYAHDGVQGPRAAEEIDATPLRVRFKHEKA